MKKYATLAAGAIACGTALALAVPAGAGATAQRDRIADRAFVQCSAGSMLQVDLEREWRKFEVDIEIYAAPRERWTVTIGTAGSVTHTFTKSTDREGELDGWRYVPRTSGVIEVRARAADGETCRAQVRG